MATKKQAPAAKRRKRPTHPTSDPAQSARFVEMAKKLGADDEAAFERAIGVLAPRKKK